jgi:hypothetical protein
VRDSSQGLAPLVTAEDLRTGRHVFWTPNDGYGVDHRIAVTIVRRTPLRVIVRLTTPPPGIPDREFPVRPDRLFETAG